MMDEKMEECRKIAYSVLFDTSAEYTDQLEELAVTICDERKKARERRACSEKMQRSPVEHGRRKSKED